MHAPLVSKDLDYISIANHDQPPRHLGSRFSAEGEFCRSPAIRSCAILSRIADRKRYRLDPSAFP